MLTAQQRLLNWQKIRFLKSMEDISKDFNKTRSFGALSYEIDLQAQLSDALLKEDYKEAAILRDKINELSK